MNTQPFSVACLEFLDTNLVDILARPMKKTYMSLLLLPLASLIHVAQSIINNLISP